MVAETPGFRTVVSGGNRRASLEALRDELAAAIESVDVRYLAPLARQLTDVLRELDALPAPEAKAPADEIARKRAERRAKASSA